MYYGMLTFSYIGKTKVKKANAIVKSKQEISWDELNKHIKLDFRSLQGISNNKHNTTVS